ncbi:MAG: SMI1/KNR4 family protein [Myxococcota bacterium]
MPTWTTCEWIRSEVSDDDVERIEAALDVQLPKRLVAIQKLHHAAVLEDPELSITLPNEELVVALNQLLPWDCTENEYILDEYDRLRRDSPVGWPERFVPFGVQGNGTVFALDYEDAPENPSVVVYERGRFVRITEDFDEFLDVLDAGKVTVPNAAIRPPTFATFAAETEFPTLRRFAVSPGWKVEISKLWDVDLGDDEDGEVPFNEATFFALHEHTGFGIDVDYQPEHEPGGSFRISIVPGDSNWEAFWRTSTTDYDEVIGLIEYAMARVSFGQPDDLKRYFEWVDVTDK